MQNETERFVGFESYGADRSSSMAIGYLDTEYLDASAGDAVPTAAAKFENCREMSVDVSGIIKIDYTNAKGVTITEVKQVTAGLPYKIRNITKLYQNYAPQTAGTAKSFNSSGILTKHAIKLHR